YRVFQRNRLQAFASSFYIMDEIGCHKQVLSMVAKIWLLERNRREVECASYVAMDACPWFAYLLAVLSNAFLRLQLKSCISFLILGLCPSLLINVRDTRHRSGV